MHLVTGLCCHPGDKVSSHGCYKLISCLADTIFYFFSSFTYPQIVLIWGNFVAFYVINLILSVVPTLEMHNVMLRLCNQPSYWITMAVSHLVASYTDLHN